MSTLSGTRSPYPPTLEVLPHPPRLSTATRPSSSSKVEGVGNLKSAVSALPKEEKANHSATPQQKSMHAITLWFPSPSEIRECLCSLFVVLEPSVMSDITLLLALKGYSHDDVRIGLTLLNAGKWRKEGLQITDPRLRVHMLHALTFCGLTTLPDSATLGALFVEKIPTASDPRRKEPFRRLVQEVASVLALHYFESEKEFTGLLNEILHVSPFTGAMARTTYEGWLIAKREFEQMKTGILKVFREYRAARVDLLVWPRSSSMPTSRL